ncbi:Alpha-xylosidase [Galdieria sulphuraria]|nr:Alpha-xylosidase [Galdieria sulphuraria]
MDSSYPTLCSWLRDFSRNSVALKDSTFICNQGSTRFTFINDYVVRCELGKRLEQEYLFEDRSSFSFLNRNSGKKVSFQVQAIEEEKLFLETEFFKLSYKPQRDCNDFNGQLFIQLKGSENAQFCPCTVEQHSKHNLGGTCRTLDEANGWKVCNWKGQPIAPDVDLGIGMISSKGFVVVDDSNTPLFDESGWPISSSQRNNICDIYIFCYGSDYRKALQLFCQVSGRVPLIPRYILGNWWSRYWRYSEDELKMLIQQFEKYRLPFSVSILDMDWHIVDCKLHDFQVFGCHPGWTGYTWNRELFPNPAALIDWLHKKILRVALNLHPADGVWPHEEVYHKFAISMGLSEKDIEKNKPIPFDITNPLFTENYFRLLHHTQEEENGVDFWWMDWQQGTKTSLEGVDPLFVLNHFHYLDHGREKSRRPFIFSRFPGLGGQRYPIGFSGDTHVTWNSLAFQPYFTATAANVGYFYWSHDIGGHFAGIEEPQLLVRWIQFGLFSPILRLHSNKNPYHSRHPWMYDVDILQACQNAMQQRHSFIPYLYTMAWRATQYCIALIEPMYYSHPNFANAYACPGQYWFGSELIVAPFVERIDFYSKHSRQVIWLPPSVAPWRNIYTGEAFEGNQWHIIYGRLEDIPVFGDNGSFQLLEDDGRVEPQVEYEKGACMTLLELKCESNRIEMNIAKAQGDVSSVPKQRDWKVTFLGVSTCLHITTYSNGSIISSTCQVVNEQRESISIFLENISIQYDIKIILEPIENNSIYSFRDRREEKIRQLLFCFHLNTVVKERIDNALDSLKKEPHRLDEISEQMLSNSQKRALLEYLTCCGCHCAWNARPHAPFVVWKTDDSCIECNLYWYSKKDGEKQPITWEENMNEMILWKQVSYQGRENIPSDWNLCMEYGNILSVVLDNECPF